MNKSILSHNKKTNIHEEIIQRDLEMVDWGFHFFVDSEIEAYKAAYQYRLAPHGAKVEFAGGVQKWMVTVFNATAKKIGVDVYG